MLPEDLEKVVNELVDNAFKFSADNTPVAMTGQITDDLKTYELTISDRGRGMTPGQIAQIGAMRQFEREHYEQQGAGLGLAIARRLVALYGGQLTIDSAAGQGCTVKVMLQTMI